MTRERVITPDPSYRIDAQTDEPPTAAYANDKVTNEPNAIALIIGVIVGLVIGFFVGWLAYNAIHTLYWNVFGHEFQGGLNVLALVGIVVITLAGGLAGVFVAIALHNKQFKDSPIDPKLTKDRDAKPARKRGYGIGAVVLAAVGVIVMFVPFFWGNASWSTPPNPGAQLQVVGPAGSAPAPAGVCQATWVIVPSDNTNNQWLNGGLESIRAASTNEASRAAANQWLAVISTDTVLLTGAYKLFFGRDYDAASLVDSNGCATQGAVDLNREIAVFLENEIIVTPDDVPENVDVYNTGVNDRVVVGASEPGITGDRSAIQLTLPDGRIIWILARCANIVTQERPPLPPGKTDENPPPVTPPQECLWPTPYGPWPLCKDTPDADSDAQGHNLSGGSGVAPVQTDSQVAPGGGTPVEVYVAPVEPVFVAPAAPIVVQPEPAPAPAPDPTVDTSTQENDGQVVLDDKGPTCNKEYESC